jgi:hypothetical protein
LPSDPVTSLAIICMCCMIGRSCPVPRRRQASRSTSGNG